MEAIAECAKYLGMVGNALLRRSLLLATCALIAWPASACKCAGSSSVCDSLGSAEIAFAGRVEATEPNFDLSDQGFRKRFSELFPGRDLDDIDLDGDISPESVAKLKQLYAPMFPGPVRSEIRGSRNRLELKKVLERAMDRGKRFTFRLYKSFKGTLAQQGVIDVWSDFSDCGTEFAKGESYLVYASKSADGKYSTGACSQNKRLTDAGADLAYFFFRETANGTDARIYGFLTSSKLDLRTPRFWDFVSEPIPEVLIELRETTSGTRLLDQTDRDGRFVFDGLEPGRYEVAALPRIPALSRSESGKHSPFRSNAPNARSRFCTSLDLPSDSQSEATCAGDLASRAPQ